GPGKGGPGGRPSGPPGPSHAPAHSQPYREATWRADSWQREGGGGYDYFQVASYCKQHGVKFSQGYYYVGRDQKHFTARWYDPHSELYLYPDPYAHGPYYWCEGHGVYYPIQYIDTVAPSAKGPGPVAAKPKGGPIGSDVGGGPGGGAVGGGAAGGVAGG